MTDNYLTISKPSEGEYKEKGSKFISLAYPVSSEEEINTLLAETRKKYHGARHLCYAWILYGENPVSRSNDDGEPSGTAGKPILGQILSNKLFNILILVVRYFGGIKLGTGKLARAYKSAAEDALNNSRIITGYIYDVFLIRTDYENLKYIYKIAENLTAELFDQRFDANCRMKLKIRKSLTRNFLDAVSNFEQQMFQISKL